MKLFANPANPSLDGVSESTPTPLLPIHPMPNSYTLLHRSGYSYTAQQTPLSDSPDPQILQILQILIPADLLLMRNYLIGLGLAKSGRLNRALTLLYILTIHTYGWEIYNSYRGVP